MPLSEKLSTPPYAEPISLAEMKLHLRVDITEDDALITSLIIAARQYVENFTSRQIIAATWKLYLDQFPTSGGWWSYESGNYATGRQRRWMQDPYGADAIRLGHAPLMGVDSIQYVDTNGVTQSVLSSVYTVDKNTEPARIVLAYNQTWPSTRGQLNAVTVTYEAGYAAPFTCTAAQPDLVVSGGSFTVGEQRRLSNSGGALPGGFAASTDYFVSVFGGVVLNGTSLRLTDEDGNLITPSGAGTGTHFIGEVPEPIRQATKLLVGEMYEHREASVAAVSKPTMDAVESLLYPYRMMEMV